MPNVHANGLTLEFDSFGPEDGEPILLISGLGVQMVRWAAPFCAALAAQGTTFRFRRAGQGQEPGARR